MPTILPYPLVLGNDEVNLLLAGDDYVDPEVNSPWLDDEESSSGSGPASASGSASGSGFSSGSGLVSGYSSAYGSASDFVSGSGLASGSDTLAEGVHAEIPGPRARVWSKMPAGLITESPETVVLEMDPEILEQRKQAFGKVAGAMLSELKAELVRLNCWSSSVSWKTLLLSFFAAVWLFAVSEEYWIEFVVANTVPEFIYLIMAPDFKPEHLLRLARVSKKDMEMGIYMDLFTDSLGKVLAWYTGSATGFGLPITKERGQLYSPGLIGRILTYFQANCVQISHDRYLHTDAGAGLKPNFIKVASCTSGYSTLHRVYWIGLENLVMLMTSFNIVSDKVTEFRVNGTREWVEAFRRKYFNVSMSFLAVKALNSCLPLKQGIRRDPRFAVDGPRRCCNPVANCPAGTDGHPNKKWRSLESGHVFSGEQLCKVCFTYKEKFGVDRPQHTIDNHIQRKVNLADGGCYWCFRPFNLESSARDRNNMVSALGDKTICKVCYGVWREKKMLPPVPGVYIDGSHQFECQGPQCPKSDKTQAYKWFFDGQTGLMECEYCRYRVPRTGRKTVKVLYDKVVDSPTAQLHPLVFSDTKSTTWFLHCKSYTNCDVISGDQDTRVQRYHLMRATFVSNGTQIHYAARDAWYGDSTAPAGWSMADYDDEDDEDDIPPPVLDEDNYDTALPEADEDSTLVDDIPVAALTGSRKRKRVLEDSDED